MVRYEMMYLLIRLFPYGELILNIWKEIAIDIHDVGTAEIFWLCRTLPLLW